MLLPDDLILNNGAGALEQMVRAAATHGGSVVAVEEVPRSETARYGIVSAEPVNERVSRVRAMVEKPKPEVAPSTQAIVGRYVLSPRVFDILEQGKAGAGGEIQLTDAINAVLAEEAVFAYRFAGRRFDCGNRRGVVEATVHLALQDPELAPIVRGMAR